MSLLIITSTINVNSGLTVLVDADERLKQYIASVLFYLSSSLIKKIIICDNSNFDYSKISSITEMAFRNKKHIEFLRFQGSKDKIQEFGKGFGEGEILEFVLNESKLIKHEELGFLKVTGRLKILNIDNVLSYLKPDRNYFNSVNLNPLIKLNKVDTRFYYCTKKDFEYYLKESHKAVNDNLGIYLEHKYFDSLIEKSVQFSAFKILPKFLGISGSTGAAYKVSNLNFFFRQMLYNLSNNIKKIKSNTF